MMIAIDRMIIEFYLDDKISFEENDPYMSEVFIPSDDLNFIELNEEDQYAFS